MKLLPFLLILVACCAYAADKQPLQSTQSSGVLTIVNNNILQDPDDCRRYVGSELVLHMFSQTSDSLLKNLNQFNDNKLEEYTRSLCKACAHKLLEKRFNQKTVSGKTVEQEFRSARPMAAQKMIQKLKKQAASDYSGWAVLYGMSLARSSQV